MLPVLVNGRWEILLPEHRAARPAWLIENGGWERERLDHMHSTTKPGDKVLYVGAEESDMCALLQMWGASVFLVEPNEKVIPNAKAIWDANGLEMPAGVYVGFCGREDSDNWADGVSIDSWPECADGPVIGDHGFKELRDPGGRPVVMIDTLVSELGFVPDMVTMDVEGAEMWVLQGAEQTLKQHKPRLYISHHPEFGIDQYGVYSRDVRNWIIDRGYDESLLSYEHELHAVYEPRPE